MKNGLIWCLVIVMAPKRKSDDMKMLAADKNEILSISGGNSSAISDHYQNIVNNR